MRRIKQTLLNLAITPYHLYSDCGTNKCTSSTEKATTEVDISKTVTETYDQQAEPKDNNTETNHNRIGNISLRNEIVIDHGSKEYLQV